jgi:hypothetical protein
MFDDNIPEPDWVEFRAGVRDKLLARSVQRAAEVRRWKLAWAFSFAAVIAVGTGLLWNVAPIETRVDPMSGNYSTQQVIEPAEWPQTGLFDDLIQLEGSEEEQLRQMLEAAQ